MNASVKGDLASEVTCVLPGLASGEGLAGAGEPVSAQAKAAAKSGNAAHRVKGFAFAMA